MMLNNCYVQGYHTGILWVFSENGIGSTFYEKRGWRKTGPAKHTDWPGLSGVKCCKLQKTLNRSGSYPERRSGRDKKGGD